MSKYFNEIVPGMPATEDALRAVKQRAHLLAAMRKHPAFGFIEAANRAFDAETRFMAGQAGEAAGEAPEALALCRTLAAVQAVGLIPDLLIEMARKYEGAEPEVRGYAAEAPLDDEGAMRAVEAAESMERFADDPGWAVLARELGAYSRCIAWLIPLVRPEARAELATIQRAIGQWLSAGQQVLDRGVDAAAWQQARLEEMSQKGKE